MNIGCIVMAAGMSSRFGGNKLAQEWQGKSLIRHALEAVPTDRLSAVMVVTQYPEVVALAKEFFFTPIVNSHPEYGQSHTIHLGVKALDACDALLFQVADQPLLRRESVAELIDFYRRNPGHIVGLGHGGPSLVHGSRPSGHGGSPPAEPARALLGRRCGGGHRRE